MTNIEQKVAELEERLTHAANAIYRIYFNGQQGKPFHHCPDKEWFGLAYAATGDPFWKEKLDETPENKDHNPAP